MNSNNKQRAYKLQRKRFKLKMLLVFQSIFRLINLTQNLQDFKQEMKQRHKNKKYKQKYRKKAMPAYNLIL